MRKKTLATFVILDYQDDVSFGKKDLMTMYKVVLAFDRHITGILKHMVPSSSGLGTLSKNNKVLLFLSASSSEYLIERGN